MQNLKPNDSVCISYKGDDIYDLDWCVDHSEYSAPKKEERRFDFFVDVIDKFNGYTNEIRSAQMQREAFGVWHVASAQLSRTALAMSLAITDGSDQHPLPSYFLAKMLDLYCFNCSHESRSFSIWCATTIDACDRYVKNWEEEDDIRISAIVAFRDFVTAVFELHLN